MMAYEAVPQAGQAGQGQEGGSGEPPPPGPATARAMALAAKLAPALPGNRFLGWLGPLLITALGTFLRFNRLSIPHAIVFDETYYVGDAYGILQHGVEINHVHNANGLLRTGSSTHILATGPEFVVHPPLGKETIAVGEWLFGLTPFGWRLMVAILGSLAILMTARIARRMTRSNLLGCIAGLLLALDGLEFVMSRTALVDISVMFWARPCCGTRKEPTWPPRPGCGRRRQVPGRGSGCAGGGWPPGCAWAWPSRRSGTVSGSSRCSR